MAGMSTSAVIALGGNLGNVPATFVSAVQALHQSNACRVTAVSPNFVTRAIGNEAGDDYVNAAVRLEVACSPIELLRTLQSIETGLGRVRNVHWGPRTLDLDLVSYGHEIIIEPGDRLGTEQPDAVAAFNSLVSTQQAMLIVPHPACWYRRFVLDPWCEIAPDWRHPVLQESVRDMRDRLRQRPLRLSLVSGPGAEKLANELRSSFSSTQIELVDPSSSGEMQFWSGSGLLPSQTVLRQVWLPSYEEMEAAKQIVRAMLDEPKRLS